MRNIFALITTTFFLFTGYGQVDSAQLFWFEKEAPRVADFQGILGVNGDFVYLFGNKEDVKWTLKWSKLHLVKMNFKTGEVVYDTTFTMPKFNGKRNPYYPNLSLLENGEVEIQAIAKDKHEGKRFWKTIVTRVNNQGHIGEFRNIGLAQQPKSASDNPGSYSVFFKSKDQQTLLTVGGLKTKKEENLKLSLRISNPDYTKNWERLIELPYETELFGIWNATVTNQGEVFLLGYYLIGFSEKAEGDFEPSDWQFKILKIPGPSEKLEEVEVQINQKSVSNMELRANQFDDKLGLYGFSSNNDAIYAENFVFALFDYDLNPVSESISPLSQKIVNSLSEYGGEKTIEETKKTAEDWQAKMWDEKYFKFTDRAVRGRYLISEIESPNANNTYVFAENTFALYTSSGVFYTYYSTMAINVKKDGKMEWLNVFPKAQAGGTGGNWDLGIKAWPAPESTVLSASGFYEGKPFVIYNGGAETLMAEGRLEESEDFKRGEEVRPVLVTVDEGKPRLFSLENEKEEIWLLTKRMVKIGPKQFLVIGYDKSQYRLGYLILNPE